MINTETSLLPLNRFTYDVPSNSLPNQEASIGFERVCYEERANVIGDLSGSDDV
jgi:hypothetical protein